MKPYKILQEHEDHFLIDHGDGRSFKVAKVGLSNAVHDKIRHFANGGPVHAADGVAVPDASADEAAAPEPIYDPVSGANLTPPSLTDEQRKELVASAPLGMLRGLGIDDATQPGPAPTTEPAPSQGVPDLLARPDESSMRQPVVSGAAAPALPGVPGELTKSEREGEAAIKAQLTAQQNEAKAQTAVLDQLAAERQKLQKDWTTKHAQWETDYASLKDAVVQGKIDPNRYWNNRDTGGKISAVIGLLLGGIGAGLTHGPNLALQVINRAIDRDIEAQKIDLGKKQTLLGMHMQEGRDALSAHQMAKADALDYASAQLQAAAAKATGDKAAAAALAASSQLHRQAVADRQSATLRDYQILGAKQQYQVGQLQMGAMGALYGGAGAQSGPPGSQGRFGVHLAPGQIGFLPEKMQEKLVQVAPGEYRTTTNTDNAKKAQEALVKADQMDTLVGELSQLAKSHPLGTWTAEDNRKAKALSDFLNVTLFSTEGGINRLNERELDAAKDIVANPSSFWGSISGGNQGKLEVLKDILHTHRASTINNLTLGAKIPLSRPKGI